MPQLPTAVGCTEILAQALEHLRKAEILAGVASTAAGHEDPAIDCILADAEEAYNEVSAALELIEIYMVRCVSS